MVYELSEGNAMLGLFFHFGFASKIKSLGLLESVIVILKAGQGSE